MFIVSFGFSTDLVYSSLDNSIKSNFDIFDKDTTYTHKKLLKCSPNIDVIYKILSADKIKIIPNIPLKSSTNYHCELNGEFFKDILSLDFTTDTFNMLDLKYFKNSNSLRVDFNDKINLDSIKSNILLFKVDNLSYSQLNYSILDIKDNSILLKINEPLGDILEVKILDKLTNRDGVKLANNIIKRLSTDGFKKAKLDKSIKEMDILDEPKIIALDNGKFVIRVYLDDSVDDFKKFIKIDGVKNYSFGEWNYIYYNYEDEDKNIDSSYYIDIKSDEFKPNSNYKITLKAGLKNYKELKEDKIYNLKSGDMKRNISFNKKEPYLSSVGEIGFSSINIDRATLILQRVTRDNYRYYINYNSANTDETTKYTEEIFAKELILDNPKNMVTKHKFLVKDLVGELKSGIYRITIDYEDREGKKIIDKSTSKVVFVSDIGVGANIAQNQAFITLISLSTAKPIEGARVDIYSKNNISIASGISDSDGIVKIDKIGLLSMKPSMVIVSSGDDKNFLYLDKSLNDISFKNIEELEDRYKAFIYFQSEIIRPDGEINALIVVKDRDFISASNLPIKLKLTSINSGKKVLSKVYTTTKAGLIDFNLKFDREYSTGSYKLAIYLGNKIIGSEVIAVESFIPPKIANKIDTKKDIYSTPEFINAKISSNYLFGMPSSNLEGTLSFSATHKEYKNSKYKNFSFSNSELEKSNELSYISQKDNFKLDKSGKSNILISTIPNQKVPSILNGRIGIKVMDDTQPVSTYKDITIYPYKNMVGVAVSSNRIEKGKEVEISTVLINPITNKKINQNLIMNIKKVTWHYSYVDNLYKWEKEVEVVESMSIKSNSTIKKSLDYGDYIIEVSDILGGHSASQELEVWWWGYSNPSPQNNLKSLDVSFEDREYKNGDTINATIKSPILEGQLIVTLEKDRVLWHKSIAISKGIAHIDIPINSNLNRGAYLHSVVIRKSDIGITPFRASSYDFIKFNRDEHKIDIDLDLVDISKSNQTQKLTIHTSKSAKVLISVVDEGILNMVYQEVPKIFEFFNDMALEQISYFDIYDKVMNFLSEGKLIDFGSDGDMLDKKKKHLPPKVDRVKPFKLWSKIMDCNGSISYDIKIPQFNGKARVVVVAINNSSIGVKSKDLIIRDDVIIKPSYPRFILSGDMIEVPIRVFNTTNSEKNISISFTKSDNLILLLKENNVLVAPKSSTIINAKLLSKNEGIGKIKLIAKDKNSSYYSDLEIGIFTPYTLESKSFQDSTTTPTNIRIDNRFIGAKASITLSNNPIGMMMGDLKYLIGYPYGCAEQTSSKLNAMLYASKYIKNSKLLRDREKFIYKGIKKLSSMQNSDGNFAYWYEGGKVDIYASIYASQTLLELDKNGFKIDENMKSKIFLALTNIVKSNSIESKYRVYAGYILSNYNRLELSLANMLYDKKLYSNYYLLNYYMSVIFKNLNMNNLSEEIYQSVANIKLSDFKEENFKNREGGYGTLSRDMAIVFYINSKYFSKSKDDFYIFKKHLSKLYSTHEKALALKALDAYIGDKSSKDIDIEIGINGELKRYSKNQTIEIDNISSPIIDINPIKGVANYSLEVYKHLPKDIKNSLSVDKDISIKREFVYDNDEKVDLNNIKQGEKFYSKIIINNKTKYNNIVINHRIPACFEIVNSRLSGDINKKSENIEIRNRDIRDDRVLYFVNLPKAKSGINEAIIYLPLIATSRGECILPSLLIEAMYDSRINDYAKESESVRVR
ncbi:Alpha-2-macroglobulin [hydrothermal vent metagenome]|uniref:Alpha-2-macroglobulin n=1 Tax=hydrothermal vent metagenome TaxID=652676 RepID=A0A1W1EHK1_9ZZZZ